MPSTTATSDSSSAGTAARVTTAGIARAARTIDAAVRDTPLVDGAPLLAALDAAGGQPAARSAARSATRSATRLLLKLETFGPVRSFKGRGTDWFVARLLEDSAADGAPPALVCASAGNFGQGLAWAGARRGIPVTVFAATTANPLKVARMRALGATVILEGHDFDAAKDAARAHVAAARQDATRGRAIFVEDGREPAIAEGAGTIALELLRDAAARGLPAPDALLVPLGNGALLAGIARWVRAESPATRLVAVCAEGAPAMARSIAEGHPVSTPEVATIADGIGVRVPVPEALDDLRGMVDEVRLVSDEAIVAAMRLLWRAQGLVVEPAGAAGLAALVAEPDAFRGATVATPLCGGNVTDEQAARWLLAP